MLASTPGAMSRMRRGRGVLAGILALAAIVIPIGRPSSGRRHRLLRLLGVLGVLAAEGLLSTTTTALPTAASSATASYRYIFADAWQGARKLVVPGQTVSGRCTYVGAPTTVSPGFVHEVREVGFEPATCTYTVEDRTVSLEVAQSDAAAAPTTSTTSSSAPAAPPQCYQTPDCEMQWANGNPYGTNDCINLYGNTCSASATWFDFCPLTLVGECYVEPADKESEASVWTGANYGVYNGCTGWNEEVPGQFAWLGFWAGDTHSSYNFNYSSSCSTVTSSESGLSFNLDWPDTCLGATIWIDNSFTGDNNENVTGTYGASMSGLPTCLATTYFIHFDYAYGTVGYY